MNAAYNMDCLGAMRKMADHCFDLAVVDPPYGIGESGAKAATRSHVVEARAYKPFAGEDRDAPPQEYFRELVRVSRNQIIFGANHFASRLPKMDTPCWIVWDKDNGGSDFAAFEMLWDSTIKHADLPICGWAANPWVWVIEFERISREGAGRWQRKGLRAPLHS